MKTFVLIIWVYSAGMTSVTGFATKEECIQAGDEIKEISRGSWAGSGFICTMVER